MSPLLHYQSRTNYNIVKDCAYFAGIPAESALELTFNNTNNNKTCGMVLGTGSRRIVISLGIEKSTVHSQLGMSLKHNIENLRNHKIPYTVNGVCYYQVTKCLPLD